MALINNIFYWQKSLDHPEPYIDKDYMFNKIITSDKKLLKQIQRLRRLIQEYCKNDAKKSEILDEIHNIIISVEKIQYTEFVAFWKVLDMSYSVFRKIPNQKSVLGEMLKSYCELRQDLYSKENSDVVVQALYDSGASRKKGVVGTNKLLGLIEDSLQAQHVKDIDSMINSNISYFLPDQGDKKLFKDFRKRYNVEYKFGKKHQGKEPDMVLKANDDFFILELKHIKEQGGAQNKQLVEVIDFIKYSESSEKIHYLSFIDGLYFNKFIDRKERENSKIGKQKNAIKMHLRDNKNNFFVNTAGMRALLKDLS